jgi:hypothetical protein
MDLRGGPFHVGIPPLRSIHRAYGRNASTWQIRASAGCAVNAYEPHGRGANLILDS